jgi:hypothetical protein
MPGPPAALGPVRVITDPLGWFTLEVPEDWEATTEDCVTTLRGVASVGTVYFSGARHVRGRQQSFGGADFLSRFLTSIGLPVPESEIPGTELSSGHRVYTFEYEGNGVSWRYWSVTDDETALLISYVCATEDAGQEDAIIDAMVASVRLFHSAP